MMKRWLAGICVAVVCFSAICLGQTEALPGVPKDTSNAKPDEILLGEEGFAGHLQGIAADESGIYWSMFHVIVKTDWTGKVLRKVRSAVHAGDCCLVNGELYVSICLYRAEEAKAEGGTGQLHVYDRDLNFLRKIKLPETPRPDGIAFLNGKFYVCNDDFGREPHPYNFIHVYDGSLKLLDKVKVDIGMPTQYGVQTLNALDGKLLAGCYGDKGKPPFLDKDTLAVVEPRFGSGVSVGFAPVPVSIAHAEHIVVIAGNIQTRVSEKQRTFSARLKVRKYENGELTPFVLNPGNGGKAK